MELCMAALLLSAFMYLNALSLVFLFCIGIGMAAPEGSRRAVWAMVRSIIDAARSTFRPDRRCLRLDLHRRHARQPPHRKRTVACCCLHIESRL